MIETSLSNAKTLLPHRALVSRDSRKTDKGAFLSVTLPVYAAPFFFNLPFSAKPFISLTIMLCPEDVIKLLLFRTEYILLFKECCLRQESRFAENKVKAYKRSSKSWYEKEKQSMQLQKCLAYVCALRSMQHRNPACSFLHFAMPIGIYSSV